MIKHVSKQRQSTSESKSSIDIHSTNVPMYQDTNIQDISKDIREQALEASDTTEIQEYGNTGINDMQKFLRQAVGLDSFKDKKERWYVTHCYNLLKKI